MHEQPGPSNPVIKFPHLSARSTLNISSRRYLAMACPANLTTVMRRALCVRLRATTVLHWATMLFVLLDQPFLWSDIKPPPQYTRRIWHIQDGLPEETVQTIRQTHDGFLWIGTTGGLVRFDGFHFMRSLQPWKST